MEERKLNFSAPLLSVRRISASKTSSNLGKGKKLENSQVNRHQRHSSCNSDATLDQVTEPAAVPFNWEQIPGIPKDCATPHCQALENGSISRRTEPPRKFFDILKQRVEKKSGEKSAQMHRIEANSYGAVVAKLDSSKEGINREEKAVDLVKDEDDEDDLYSDALETFSPGDSVSINCSASGVSNLDGQIVEPSGTFSTDHQVQDFMMSRFLPAAKAMALNPPHSASKKQPVGVEQRQIVKMLPLVVVEQSRQIINVVNVDRRPPAPSSLVPVHSQYVEDSYSEDEDYEVDSNPAHISTKACGLLPRLCIKNSLSIFNPIPVLKSMSPRYEGGKPSKITCSRSQSPTTKKHPVIIGGSNKKPDNISKSPRLVEYENKLKFGSNRFTLASDRKPMSRTSSPLRRSACTSPNRAQSPFKDRMRYIGSPQNVEPLKANRVPFLNKGGSKSQELLPHHVTKQWSCPMIPAIEKTLHVDTVKKTQNPHQVSGKDFSSLLKSREVEKRAATKSSLHNVKCLVVPERKSNTTIKSLVSVEADSSVIDCDKSPPRGQGDKEEDPFQECKALVRFGSTIDSSDNNNANCISEDNDLGNTESSIIQLPAPPPLPKMPSESWLWRTLPSLSSPNPFSDVYRRVSFRSKEQDPNPSSADSKWETIVKSSYLHHDHVRYSEELVRHALQRSRR